MKPIAVFYHCLFYHNDRVVGGPDDLRPGAVEIVRYQMEQLTQSGLLEACQEFHVGINGGQESADAANCIIPAKAKVMMHGLNSKSETPTIVALQLWAMTHPDWYVLYFHSKGATHVDREYLKFVARWRRCMMENLIVQWQRCVADLDAGFDSAGCHWMVNVGVPPKDNIWGGNFWWVKTDFLRTLELIMERPLIKEHGIHAPIARYESERFLGAGPTLPKIKDYHVNGIGACP